MDTNERKLKGYLTATHLTLRKAPSFAAADKLKHRKWLHRHRRRVIGFVVARNGQQNLAQGFNPGFNVPTRRALKGHQIGVFAAPRAPAAFKEAKLIVKTRCTNTICVLK